MKLFSLFAPKRMLTLALPALATLFAFGLTGLTAAQATSPGYLTAKTWIDPATGHAAYGDGIHDDTQNLQDMINYVLNTSASHQGEAIQLEPGTYKITKTLMIQNPPLGGYMGFRLSGMSGPNNDNTTYLNSGVTISLVTSDTTQLAVLEVGAGAIYDINIENLGLDTSVNGQPNSIPIQYGLLFGGQQFSHAIVRNVSVNAVGTAFGIDGTTGGNGESVNIDDCLAWSVNCFYYNNCGQALCHSITKSAATINNGGSAIKVGVSGTGMGLDITSLSVSFVSGPLRNTLIECNALPGSLNETGGRVELCDTIIRYAGGSPAVIGHITLRGMDFDGCGINGTKYPAFGLMDDTLNGHNAQQYTNTIEQCRFNGSYGAPFPALSLTTFSVSGDYSKNYFDRDTFTGYSNNLTDLTTDLGHLGAKVRDCRSATGAAGAFFHDISYP